jgi:ribosome-binding factor A
MRTRDPSDSSDPFDPFDRKLKQICREVYRVLSQCDLEGATVIDVWPAPDGSRLAVKLALEPGADADADAVLARLEQRKGSFRAEIAAALQRKRTPLLAFHVVPDLDPGSMD